jgi:hypothetical protein
MSDDDLNQIREALAQELHERGRPLLTKDAVRAIRGRTHLPPQTVRRGFRHLATAHRVKLSYDWQEVLEA